MIICYPFSVLRKEVWTQGLRIWSRWRYPPERPRWLREVLLASENSAKILITRCGIYAIFGAMRFQFIKQFVYIACYAQRFGPRGVGHAGGSFLGLMCDALDLEWQR